MCFLELSDVGFGEVVGIDLDGSGFGTSFDDFGQGAFLVVGGALNGGDELRYEVGTAFVDVFDLTPCLRDGFFAVDEFVIDADAPEDGDGDDGDDG